MRIEEGDHTAEGQQQRSSFKRLFYVNRKDFTVTVQPDDGKLSKVGALIPRINNLISCPQLEMIICTTYTNFTLQTN